MNNAQQLLERDPSQLPMESPLTDDTLHGDWQPFVATFPDGRLVVALDPHAAYKQGLTDPSGRVHPALQGLVPTAVAEGYVTEDVLAEPAGQPEAAAPASAEEVSRPDRRHQKHRPIRGGNREARAARRRAKGNAHPDYQPRHALASANQQNSSQIPVGKLLARHWQTENTADLGRLSIPEPVASIEPAHDSANSPEVTSTPQAAENQPTTLRQRLSRRLGMLSLRMNESKYAAAKKVAEFAFDVETNEDGVTEAKLSRGAKIALLGIAAVKAYGLSRGLNTGNFGNSFLDMLGTAPGGNKHGSVPDVISPELPIPPSPVPTPEVDIVPETPIVTPPANNEGFIGEAGTDSVWELIEHRYNSDAEATSDYLEQVRDLNQGIDLDHVAPGQRIILPAESVEPPVAEALPVEQVFASDTLVGQNQAGNHTASEVILEHLGDRRGEFTPAQLDDFIQASVEHDAQVHRSLGQPVYDVYSMPEGYRFYTMPPEAIDEFMRRLHDADNQ